MFYTGWQKVAMRNLLKWLLSTEIKQKFVSGKKIIIPNNQPKNSV